MAEGEVTITVRPNGPFRVEGPIKLVNTDGTLIDLGRQTCRFSLSLRSLDQQAILRRNPFQDRFPGRGSGGSRVRRKTLNGNKRVVP